MLWLYDPKKRAVFEMSFYQAISILMALNIVRLLLV